MRLDNFPEIARARAALWRLDPGTDREAWVKTGMAAKAAGLSFNTWHEWSATAGNYRNEADCRSVWQSIKAGAVTEASLFHAARAAGWTDAAEAPAKRMQSHQEGPKQPEASKSPLHNPSALWDACAPATAEHPYVIKKLGLTDGLRVYLGPMTISGKPCDGALVLPVRTFAGELASLQFIMLDGSKLFLPGCKLPHDGCLIVGGPIKSDEAVHITEGIGQAWSAHQATRQPAVVTFGVGRMAGVARALRERCPAVRLVLVADAGKESQCAAIAKSISGSWVEMPAGSPSNFDLNDFHQAEGLAAVRALLEGVKEHPQRFRFQGAEQFAEQPPLEWLVKGLLPRRGVVALYGPSGCGKSFLALDLFGAIIEGREWFGRRTVRAPVLYLCLEGSGGFSKRLAAYRQEVGNLSGMQVLAEQFVLNDRQDEVDIVDAIRAQGLAGGVVCIDTLAQATPGLDENSGEGMTSVIAACQRIQQATDTVLVLIHHCGKDVARGLRGHSSLIGALDASIEVSGGLDDAPRQWEARKVKDDSSGEAHLFDLRRVVLGVDADGDEITSCVVDLAEAAGDGIRKARIPGGGNMRIAWDRLGELLRTSGYSGKASAPAGRPCVDLEVATADIAERLTCDKKRRRERAEQAITALVARQLLGHEGGWLWLK